MDYKYIRITACVCVSSILRHNHHMLKVDAVLKMDFLGNEEGPGCKYLSKETVEVDVL